MDLGRVILFLPMVVWAAALGRHEWVRPAHGDTPTRAQIKCERRAKLRILRAILDQKVEPITAFPDLSAKLLVQALGPKEGRSLLGRLTTEQIEFLAVAVGKSKHTEIGRIIRKGNLPYETRLKIASEFLSAPNLEINNWSNSGQLFLKILKSLELKSADYVDLIGEKLGDDALIFSRNGLQQIEKAIDWLGLEPKDKVKIYVSNSIQLIKEGDYQRRVFNKQVGDLIRKHFWKLSSKDRQEIVELIRNKLRNGILEVFAQVQPRVFDDLAPAGQLSKLDSNELRYAFAYLRTEDIPLFLSRLEDTSIARVMELNPNWFVILPLKLKLSLLENTDIGRGLINGTRLKRGSMDRAHFDAFLKQKFGVPAEKFRDAMIRDYAKGNKYFVSNSNIPLTETTSYERLAVMAGQEPENAWKIYEAMRSAGMIPQSGPEREALIQVLLTKSLGVGFNVDLQKFETFAKTGEFDQMERARLLLANVRLGSGDGYYYSNFIEQLVIPEVDSNLKPFLYMATAAHFPVKRFGLELNGGVIQAQALMQAMRKAEAEDKLPRGLTDILFRTSGQADDVLDLMKILSEDFVDVVSKKAEFKIPTSPAQLIGRLNEMDPALVEKLGIFNKRGDLTARGKDYLKVLSEIRKLDRRAISVLGQPSKESLRTWIEMAESLTTAYRLETAIQSKTLKLKNAVQRESLHLYVRRMIDQARPKGSGRVDEAKVTAAVNEKVVELVANLIGNGGRFPVDANAITKLKTEWKSLDAVMVLLGRYSDREEWKTLVPEVGKIFGASFQKKFREFKFEGFGGEEEAAKTQLKAFESAAARKAWAADESKVQFAEAADAMKSASDEAAKQLATAHAQLKQHISENLGNIARLDRSQQDEIMKYFARRPAYDPATLPTELKGSDKKAVARELLSLIEESSDRESVRYYSNWIGKWAETVRADLPTETFTDVLNDIRALQAATKPVGEAGKNTKLLITATVAHPRPLLEIGDKVPGVSSCQNYRCGGVIQTLPGYVKDANVVGVLSAVLSPADLVGAERSFNRLQLLEKQGWKLEAEVLPSGTKFKITASSRDGLGAREAFETIDVEMSRRHVLKAGAVENSESAGLFLERAYSNQNSFQGILGTQVQEVMHLMSRKTGAKLGQEVKIERSRNPGGVYSDAGGGVKTSSYTIPANPAQALGDLPRVPGPVAIEIEPRLIPKGQTSSSQLTEDGKALLKLTTTTDGSLKSLADPASLSGTLQEELKQVAQAQGVQPADLAWKVIPPVLQHRVLIELTAQHGGNFFLNRKIPGLILRSESNTPAAKNFMTYVEYGSPQDTAHVGLAEIHMRTQVADAPEFLQSSVQVLREHGIGKDKFHVHVLGGFNAAKMAAHPQQEALEMVEFAHRLDLAAQMISVVEKGFSLRKIANPVAGSDLTVRTAKELGELAEVVELYSTAKFPFSVGDRFKGSFVGWHFPDKYEGPGRWMGAQFRTVDEARAKSFEPLLRAAQRGLNDQIYGLPEGRVERWKELQSSGLSTGELAERLSYRKPLGELLMTADPSVREAVRELGQSFFEDFENNMELGMLIYRWDLHPIRPIGAVISKAQVMALHEYRNSRNAQQAVKKFLTESGLYQTVMDSLR